MDGVGHAELSDDPLGRDHRVAAVGHRAGDHAPDDEADGEVRQVLGERDAEVLRQVMRAVLAAEPLAQVDYVSAADAETLRECEGALSGAVLLSMAVRIGRARLIDNITVGE